jgi:hypothetical protein
LHSEWERIILSSFEVRLCSGGGAISQYTSVKLFCGGTKIVAPLGIDFGDNIWKKIRESVHDLLELAWVFRLERFDKVDFGVIALGELAPLFVEAVN